MTVITNEIIPSTLSAAEIREAIDSGLKRTAQRLDLQASVLVSQSFEDRLIQPIVMGYASQLIAITADLARDLCVFTEVGNETDSGISALSALREAFQYLLSIDFSKLAEDKVYCGSEERLLLRVLSFITAENEVMKAMKQLTATQNSRKAARKKCQEQRGQNELLAVFKEISANSFYELADKNRFFIPGRHYEAKWGTEEILQNSLGIHYEDQYDSYWVYLPADQVDQYFELKEIRLVPGQLSISG